MGKKKDNVFTPKVKTKPVQSNSINADNVYILLFCVFCTAVIYFSSVWHNQFTNWDDNVYVAENEYIRSWNMEMFTATVNANWAPVYTFLLAIEYHLFGFNPAGYHLTSLLLHLLNVILVFTVILKISRKHVVAGIAALFFGIHPMHVEPVAWVSSQKDVLYTFFYLAAMLTYAKHIEYRGSRNLSRIIYLLFTGLFFILSCLSKGMGETLPVTLVLMDCFYEDNWSWKFMVRSAWKKTAFFLLSVVFGITAYIALQKAGALDEHLVGNTFVEQIMFACYSLVVYITKFIFPFSLSALYLYPIKNAEGAYPVIYYLSPVIVLVLAGLITAVIIRKKKQGESYNILLFGFLFFLTNLILVLQLKTITMVMLAERYTYLSYVGLLFITAEAVNSFWEKYNRQFRREMLGAYCLVVVFFGYIASNYTDIWHNSITLWTDVINKVQSTPLKNLNTAYNNRGLAYKQEGKFDLAVVDYTVALSLDSHFVFGYNNRGLAYMKQGKPDMAMADYTKAISLDSNYVSPYYNRGLAYASQKKTDLAMADYTKAINLNPKFVDIYNDRGLAYMKQGKPDSALSDFNKAISINPQFVSPYYNRGLLYANYGNPDLAINDYTTAIELDPLYPDTYNDRGLAYMRKGKASLAIADYSSAIRLNPQFVLPYYNRGLLNAGLGKFDSAILDYTKVISLNPQYAAAYSSRSVAEEIKGNHAQAQEDIQKAKELGWTPAK